MKQRRRIYYSAAQRSEIWDRWQAGEPMSSIGRRFDRESSSVFSVISPTGGIRPPDRHRTKQALSLSEREEISRWLSMSAFAILLPTSSSARAQGRVSQNWIMAPCPIVALRMLLGTRGDCECEKSRPIFTLAYAIALSKRESAFASPELRSIGDARTTRANAGR
jgi:hypothetical protein